MAYVLADNIISPLGQTAEENYKSVKAGLTGLHAYAHGSLGIPEAFTASLLTDDQIAEARRSVDSSLTRFEAIATASAQRAVSDSGIDPTADGVVLILSTTKGSVEQLAAGDYHVSDSAKRIAAALGIKADPIVVCNACISGLSALILASRLIDAGRCTAAVVCGADSPEQFIISGFQSLKALSPEPCRPFDMERYGLNLGEAAATIVLSAKAKAGSWRLGNGYVRNDAFHISAPSKAGEGLYQALTATLQGVDASDLAFVNAHGTATLFNDQMESMAMKRADLLDVPLNALKGYFGHTLGAAGVLETIISMHAADDHTVLGTRGFEELGVSGKVNVSASSQTTDKHCFVKMLSGFGGCNATILADKAIDNLTQSDAAIERTHRVMITPSSATVDGKTIPVGEGASLLTALYKEHIADYPKYYKMDALCRLGFVASELLLKAAGGISDQACGVVLFNRSSSVVSDRKYLESTADADNYFPSPSVFVYTLPNIVTGEIAIRNGFHGETSFFILPEKSQATMDSIIATAFADSGTNTLLTGWIDYDDDLSFEADMWIAQRKNK